MAAIFVKGSGGSQAAAGMTFIEGVKADYVSGSVTKSMTITALMNTLVTVVFGRSNRNTSDTITWTIKKNGSTIQTFTASTGGLKMTAREYTLDAGDTLTVQGSGAGYSGYHNAFVAEGIDSIAA